MKTRILLLFIALMLQCEWSKAQKENHIWAFGQPGIGIDFNTSPPSPLATSILSHESSATVCDAAGNLLFYSNGTEVWDKTHTMMPNGTGLLGAPYKSSTQGVSIVPVAGSANLYFLFTLEEYSAARTGYLRYSVIDMTLNGGNGDVVSGKKNILLDSSMSEKMITAPACDGVWVITHHQDSANFYAYKVNSAATIETPVISRIAGVSATNKYIIGELKLSPDKSKIAIGNWHGAAMYSKIELFDFNWKTGILSGYYPLDSSRSAYSVEFSPDNSKLYVVEFSSQINQYDLSLLPSLPAVIASKFKLPLTEASVGMRRGPDDKIYFKRSILSEYICRINDPNVAGLGCNVEIDVPTIKFPKKANFLLMGNPVSVSAMEKDSLTVHYKDTLICDGISLIFKGDEYFENFIWNDGDTNQNRTINAGGVYSLKSTKGCLIKIDSINIKIKPSEITTKILDTLVCFKEEIMLNGASGYSQYLWNDGITTHNNSFKSNGKVWVTSSKPDCKFLIDTFNIKIINFKVNLPDTFICTDQTIKLDAGNPYATEYLWQDGSKESHYIASQAGAYWVKISAEGCTLREDVTISQNPNAAPLGSDTTICEGEQFTYHLRIENATFQWNTGSQSPGITIDKAGKYSVLVNQNGCITTDEVEVFTKFCQNCIAIANAFTPNNDGINDVFRVKAFCPYLQYELKIFNRYGEEVFNANSPNIPWKGTFKNQDLSSGVYYYFIKVKFDNLEAKEEIYKGDITLIR